MFKSALRERTEEVLIDGGHYRAALKLYLELLKRHRKRLNRINVFPVADGDTGDNLYLTLKGIWEDLRKTGARSFREVAKVVSDSALKNAQGNSGNIIAMFFYGIYEYAKNKHYLYPEDLIYAFEMGFKHAYSAVKNPREGTILTAMRATVETAKKEIGNGYSSYTEIFRKCVKAAIEELKKSKKNVPQLEKYDVIDAGGLGFVIMLKAWANDVEDDLILELTKKEVEVSLTGRYCVNMLIKLNNGNLKELERLISNVGDSVIIKKFSDKVKLHFHCAVETFDDIMAKIFDLGEVISQEVNLA